MQQPFSLEKDEIMPKVIAIASRKGTTGKRLLP